MSVAIVILNFNGLHFLEKFLPKVIENSKEGHIYVADNGSSDGSVDFLRVNFPDVICLSWEKNLGYAGGYNNALKQINSDYYVLMNSDIEPKADWLLHLLTFFKTHPRFAAAQPFILDYHKPKYFEYAGAAGGYWDRYGYPFCRGRIFDSVEKNEGQYQTSQVQWATGACLMIQAKAYWEVGGLDEYLFAHMEEIDLCWRLQRAGYQIAAVAESEVLHVGGGTLQKGNPFKTYLNFRNNLILLYKNVPNNQRNNIIWMRLFLDAIAGVKFVLEGEFKQMLAIIKAHFGFYDYVLFNKNKVNLDPKLEKNPVESYHGIIIMEYYIKKIKKYSDL